LVYSQFMVVMVIVHACGYVIDIIIIMDGGNGDVMIKTLVIIH
jgi:hypothetical protein